MLKDLHGLAEGGVVHACTITAGTGEAKPGKWMVTHFVKWQVAIPADERVRKFRERNGDAATGHVAASGHFVTNNVTKRYKKCNEGETGSSTSTSDSIKEVDKIDFPSTQRKRWRIRMCGYFQRLPADGPGVFAVSNGDRGCGLSARTGEAGRRGVARIPFAILAGMVWPETEGWPAV